MEIYEIATSPLGVSVIKLGGSLLEFDGLVSAWTLWLSKQSPAANVVIVGGGKLVDALRDLDQANSLGDEAGHWLSVRAMGYTAANVASILPNVELVSRMDELDLTTPARQFWTCGSSSSRTIGLPPVPCPVRGK